MVIKSQPKKSENGPVATRTRLKLGSPIYQTTRVQYPESWPLLPHAIAYSKLEKLGPGESASVTNNQGSKEEVGLNVPPKQTSQPSLINLPIEPCKRRKRQRAMAGKKIRGSRFDFVVYKSKAKHKGVANGRRTQIVKRDGGTTCKRRRIGCRSKGIAKSKPSRQSRRISRRGRQNKRQLRGKRRKSSRSVRRKKAAKQRRKKRGQKVAAKRRRRRHRRKLDESPERRYGLDTGVPIGHALDHMLRQKSSLPTETFEKSLEEVQDDPLNINDLCRALVKSLPGVPADIREENPEETSKPISESRRRQNKDVDKNLQRAISKILRKDKTAKKDRTGYHCKQEEKKLNRHRPTHKTLRVKYKRTRTRNCNQNRRQPKIKEVKRREKKKTHTPGRGNKSVAKATHISKNKIGKGNNKDKATTDSIKVPRRKALSLSSPELSESEAQDGSSENSFTVAVNPKESMRTKNGKKVNKIDAKENKESVDVSKKKRIVMSKNGRLVRKVHVTDSENEDNKDELESTTTEQATRSTTTDLKSKRVAKPVSKNSGGRGKTALDPYYGRPVPINRRNREDIDVVRHQKRRIEDLAKRVSKKRSQRTSHSKNKSKNRTVKSKKEETHRRTRSRGRSSSDQARFVGRARHRRQPTSRGKTSRHKRYPPREGAAHRRRVSRLSSRVSCRSPRNHDNSSNNNVNNNQMDLGSWGRVSGRLLRIGRYLFRKFRILFWV